MDGHHPRAGVAPIVGTGGAGYQPQPLHHDLHFPHVFPKRPGQAPEDGRVGLHLCARRGAVAEFGEHLELDHAPGKRDVEYVRGLVPVVPLTISHDPHVALVLSDVVDAPEAGWVRFCDERRGQVPHRSGEGWLRIGLECDDEDDDNDGGGAHGDNSLRQATEEGRRAVMSPTPTVAAVGSRLFPTR